MTQEEKLFMVCDDTNNDIDLDDINLDDLPKELLERMRKAMEDAKAIAKPAAA